MLKEFGVIGLWQEAQEVLNALKRLRDAIEVGAPIYPTLYEYEGGWTSPIFPEKEKWHPGVVKATQNLLLLMEEMEYREHKLLDPVWQYARGVTTQLGLDRFDYTCLCVGIPDVSDAVNERVRKLEAGIAELEEDPVLKDWLYERSKQKLLEWEPPELTYDTPAPDTPADEPLALAHTDAIETITAAPVVKKTHTTAKNVPWWHDPTEPRPAEYRHGPITGTQAEISRWLGEKKRKMQRRLQQKATSGVVWVIRQTKTAWEVWFKDQTVYETADLKRKLG